MRRFLLPLILAAGLSLCGAARAGVEVFGKGSISKNFITSDTFTTSLSLSGGLAISLFPQVRLEARYTNNSELQNQLNVAVGNIIALLSNIQTTTSIYSLGLDIDVLSEKSWFQPFIFVGAGYVVTQRSYYVQANASSPAFYQQDPTDFGISGNLGLGFRLRVARAVAFEVEVFSYAMNLGKPNPLINLYATVGLRIFF